jgi:hypothetical protein
MPPKMPPDETSHEKAQGTQKEARSENSSIRAAFMSHRLFINRETQELHEIGVPLLGVRGGFGGLAAKEHKERKEKALPPLRSLRSLVAVISGCGASRCAPQRKRA